MDDTRTLAGIITNLGDGALQFCVEAERRVGDNWRIEAEARTLANVDAENELSALKSDSFVNVCVASFSNAAAGIRGQPSPAAHRRTQ